MIPNPSQIDTLLLALTQGVRFLSEAQIARLWNRPDTSPGRILERLHHQGLLNRHRLALHPELRLEAPLLTWRPSAPVPDFGRAAYACKVRWTQAPALTTVWHLTPDAAQRLGAVPGLAGVCGAQATHDLHMAALYVRFRTIKDAADARWLPERALRARVHERLPDALIVDAQGTPLRALDFGGSANAWRIAKLYAYARRYDLPFELW